MEKKIVYLKLFQIVLTLAFIWQLISLHQFCGTFADPKTFIHDNISVGHCKSFMLIGKDSKTGEFGIVLYNKLRNQFFMNHTNSTQELKCQFFDFLAAKLPPAGRQCIPIMITPFDLVFDWIFEWTGLLYRNPLNNRTLFHFSRLFFFALLSLVLLGYGIMKMLRSVEEYELEAYSRAFTSAFVWFFAALCSYKLLVNWNAFWTCANFQADHTNVPLSTLVLSIVLVFSSIFEIVLHEFLLNDVDMESANVTIIDQQQQPKKNESAIE